MHALEQAAFPHPATDEHRACVELLGPLNADVTRRALALMAAGDVPALGLLMSEAQALFRQRAAPLCPSQLDSPVLHAVLAHPPIQPHIYGGKGVGSQVPEGWEAGRQPRRLQHLLHSRLLLSLWHRQPCSLCPGPGTGAGRRHRAAAVQGRGGAGGGGPHPDTRLWRELHALHGAAHPRR